MSAAPGEKIVVLTAYRTYAARIADDCCDVLLVGVTRVPVTRASR